MTYITVALGAGCDDCHDVKRFESDNEPEKTQARNMIKMMFAIKRENFNGSREVTCCTCHRGAGKAARIPLLSSTAVPPRSAPVATPREKAAMKPSSGTPPCRIALKCGSGSQSVRAGPRRRRRDSRGHCDSTREQLIIPREGRTR